MDTDTQLTTAGNTGDFAGTEVGIRTLTRSRLDLAKLEANVAHYPEPIRSAVVWMQNYWANTLHGNGEALRVIGEKLGKDEGDSWYSNLLKGYNFQPKNPAGVWKKDGRAWSEFLEFFENLKRYAQQAARTGKQAMVLTPTYRLTEGFINEVRALNAVCKFGGITGPTGSQKTRILRYYAEAYNHGSTTLVQAVANARLSAQQRKIAERIRATNTALARSGQRDTLIRSWFNDSRTLIIDNAQFLYVDGAGSKQPAFNWLIELQEDTGCTIILCFTTDFVDTLTAGRAKGYFEQFIGRMGGMDNILRFPSYTPVADLRVIAKHYGLDAGTTALEKYLQPWSREDGRIRIVFHRLQRAQTFAKADGRERIQIADLEAAKDYRPSAIGTDEEDSQ